MARQYYFLSDLHFGGDGELMHCDFSDEFVAFLDGLGRNGEDAELIIGGDTFGFWELTTDEGTAKLDAIVAHHQPVFAALKSAGERVRITIMVGNHDYDLACVPGFAERLAEYNLHLDASISLTREMLGRTIWIEHGQQVDPFNASPDYGNRYALPVGYFITETLVAGASRFSAFGRGNWLKDIRSVATDLIPDWALSNYFYREMGPVIRWIITVFLLLLTVTGLALVAEALRLSGVISANYLINNRFLSALGYVGSIFSAIVVVNMLVLVVMLILAVPGFLVLRDLRKTLHRFHITTLKPSQLEGQGNETYLRRAREVFAEHPEAAVYIFGHTHHAFLEQEDGRVILNMGTWLKILDRVPVRFGYLPSVFYPTFRLGYFHILEEEGRIVIRRVEVPKVAAAELSLLQRFVTFGRALPAPDAIPARVVVEP
ncbi:MAG: metallophosphoesterase [Rhizobiales bacterium]|nr:metallophosphoesterase [Hyphomicrobiales bacterium]